LRVAYIVRIRLRSIDPECVEITVERLAELKGKYERTWRQLPAQSELLTKDPLSGLAIGAMDNLERTKGVCR